MSFLSSGNPWFALLGLLFGNSCNMAEPPPAPPEPSSTIMLEVEDVGVTEAWLRLSIPDTISGRSFTLLRDTVPILSTSLMMSDTILLDEGLLPNHTYNYQAHRLADTTIVDASDEVAVTTMDTTSHAFVFDVDMLGGASSSVLLGVGIIDENNIWAVGEIYVNDSTGQIDPRAYGAAVWDGNGWNLKRFFYQRNSEDLLIAPIRGILAFSNNDIWFAAGSVFHWNGLVITPHLLRGSILFDGETVEKLWSIDGTSIYGVGNEGTIVHYNGVSWRKIESGTELHVYDVFGGTNPTTGEIEVYAVAAEQFVSFNRRILKIEGNSVVEVSDSTIPSSLHGVWFNAGRRYYVVGSGIYTKRDIRAEGPWQWLHPGVTPYYSYAVRGNDLNDIAVCGGLGELLHFNGWSWRSFRSEGGNLSGNYYGIAIKGNLCVAVGGSSSYAITAVGNR